MNGIAVLRAIAAESPIAIKRAYILFTATYGAISMTVLEDFKQVPMLALPKPFDLEEVLAAVQTAASTHRAAFS